MHFNLIIMQMFCAAKKWGHKSNEVIAQSKYPSLLDENVPNPHRWESISHQTLLLVKLEKLKTRYKIEDF